MSIEIEQKTINSSFVFDPIHTLLLRFSAIHIFFCSASDLHRQETTTFTSQIQQNLPLVMEWYFGRDDEDLAVPKDEEICDRLPSPDSWPSWINIVGNLNAQKKLNVLGVEELLLSEQMLSRHAFRHQSACAHEHSDAQLNDLPKIEEADDIFFDSIFKVDAEELEGSYSSAYATQTSNRSDEMAVDFSNHIQDSTDDASDVHHFSPEKELEADICMFEDRSDWCEDISEYISMDEPVLLELQNLTQQLADTTRICFRDSLYRLAENSSYQTKSSRSGKKDLNNCKPIDRVGPSRLQESKTNESDTNAIDRTVATLLFTTMTFCDSTAASTSTSGLDEETLQREYQANSCAYHPGYFNPSLCIVEGGDAEVPTFDSCEA